MTEVYSNAYQNESSMFVTQETWELLSPLLIRTKLDASNSSLTATANTISPQQRIRNLAATAETISPQQPDEVDTTTTAIIIIIIIIIIIVVVNTLRTFAR